MTAGGTQTPAPVASFLEVARKAAFTRLASSPRKGGPCPDFRSSYASSALRADVLPAQSVLWCCAVPESVGTRLPCCLS